MPRPNASRPAGHTGIRAAPIDLTLDDDEDEPPVPSHREKRFTVPRQNAPCQADRTNARAAPYGFIVDENQNANEDDDEDEPSVPSHLENRFSLPRLRNHLPERAWASGCRTGWGAKPEVVDLTEDVEVTPKSAGVTSPDAKPRERPRVRLPSGEKSPPTTSNGGRKVYDFTSEGDLVPEPVVRQSSRPGTYHTKRNPSVSAQRISRRTEEVPQIPRISPRRTATMPRKPSTPRRQQAEVSGTPSRRSRRTTIEDSEVLVRDGEDTEMHDAMLALEPEPPRILQWQPLDARVPEPPPAKVIRNFTDWTPPEVPLDYEVIKELWDRFVDEFKDDHQRYAADKTERERMYNQKAEKAYIDYHRQVDEQMSSKQSSANWWDAPTISTPAAGKPNDNQFTFTVKSLPHAKGTQPTKLYVGMAQMTSKSIDVPHYKTYYPIRKSQLVQSDRDLLFWPEATERDELSEDEIKKELKGQFHFRMLSSRGVETKYSQIGRQWQPYFEAFLEELHLSDEDMLRFLLDSQYDANEVKAELLKIKHAKREMNPWKLLRETRKELGRAPQSLAISKKLSALREEEKDFALKPLKFKYLALAFYAVSGSYREHPDYSCFNVVYCLRWSPKLDMAKFLETPGQQTAIERPQYSATTHFDLACRICHVYPCFVHGLDSMWDYRPPDPLYDSDAEDDDTDSVEDSLCPLFDTLTHLHQRTLGRKPVRAPQMVEQRPERDGEFDNEALYGHPNRQSKVVVFFPCNHQGPCEEGVCHCAHRFCEKSCGCDASCKNRFKGCKCARKGKVCSEESRCPCLKADRECDPDLCGTCGVYDALDPQNRHEEDPAFFRDKCQNCQIQRNVPKRTLIGQSTVHGIGLYAGEDIKKGEYIGEYLGAKLNWKQAERSGLYLLLNGYSYLFDMTGDQTVDSMVLGNKMRFINSIAGKWNCAPKVLMCNTEHRMALYATRDIPGGEELSFNYGEKFFDNHKDSALRKMEKEKLKDRSANATSTGKKYNRKPYGKRGPYKTKGKKAVAVKEKNKAATVRKTLSKGVRPPKQKEVSIQMMVDALGGEDEEDEDADVEGGAEVDVDMDNESVDDSMDEDFEDEESD